MDCPKVKPTNVTVHLQCLLQERICLLLLQWRTIPFLWWGTAGVECWEALEVITYDLFSLSFSLLHLLSLSYFSKFAGVYVVEIVFT